MSLTLCEGQEQKRAEPGQDGAQEKNCTTTPVVHSDAEENTSKDFTTSLEKIRNSAT